MTYLLNFNYGPGYLEFFLDLIAFIALVDLLAVLLLLRFLWKHRTTKDVERKIIGYDNVAHETEATQESKQHKDTSTQTEDVVVLIKKEYDVLIEAEGKLTENDGKIGTETDSKTSNADAIKEEGVEDLVPPLVNANVQKSAPPRTLERRKSRDDIVFKSGWRKTVKLQDLIRAKVIEESRVVELEEQVITEEEVERELRPFLIGQYPIAGIFNDQTGQKMSLFDAHKQRIISRGTALSLLEAQAAVGSIIDPITDDKMSVEEALEHNLLDRAFAAVLVRAQRAVTGYTPRGSDEKLSLFQAMKRGLIVENHGIRLLEAQIATGGIIDPVANHRLPVEVAFERGLFDERLHQTLDDPSDDTKGFLDPNTNENLTYLELIKRCVEDPETNLLLLPLVRDDEVKLYKNRKLSHESIRQRITSSGSRSIESDN
uniref:Desmoplakin-like n=1 Tax=Phallusia mammillata TaxID=59560 RepID=A0A6F9DAT3_9ASCI|nr:desmoplakin-like [Phallusia mammillata]